MLSYNANKQENVDVVGNIKWNYIKSIWRSRFPFVLNFVCEEYNDIDIKTLLVILYLL